MEELKKIAIHSVPRSGSTWLGSIFDSHPQVIYKLQPLFSYALKGKLGIHSSGKDIDDFFAALRDIQDDFMDQRNGKNRGIIPEFKKDNPKAIVYKEVRYHYILRNLLTQDTDIKIIGLIRNPLSVISSWLKAPKEFRADKGWKIEEEWRFAAKKNLDKPEEYNGYEKWKEVTRLFETLQSEFPSRFYLLNYDELLRKKEEIIEPLFSFCGLEMHAQVASFVQRSSTVNQQDAYSVFKTKQKDDGWKTTLPDYIINGITKDPDFIALNSKYNWL